MLQKIFTVYDSKAESYSNPVYLNSTGLAVRTLSALGIWLKLWDMTDFIEFSPD